MQIANLRKTLCSGLLVTALAATTFGQRVARADSPTAISTGTMLRILRAEDERRSDPTLGALLTAPHAIVRKRAALALGRIGDEGDLPTLITALRTERDQDVRQMCAFAIGEIESPAGADELIAILNDTREPGEVRARAVEALGKIGAVRLSLAPASGPQTTSPKIEDKALTKIQVAILDALKFESGRRSMPDRSTILLGLTAALRVRPDGAGPVIVKFLGYSDPRIVADALNAMARLRVKDDNDQVRQLLNHSDATVRANAARVIGAAEDKGAYDSLLTRALTDNDVRVRVSAIRALGSLKDARAATPLLDRCNHLYAVYRIQRARGVRASEANEILEIVNSLGRVLTGTNNQLAIEWLRKLGPASPEVNIAFARIAPQTYIEDTTVCCPNPPSAPLDGKYVGSAVDQGWAELAAGLKGRSVPSELLRQSLCVPGVDRPDCNKYRATVLRRSDAMRAYAAFKPNDLGEVLRKQLVDTDVVVRATAAELLGELPPDPTNEDSLIHELPRALQDKDLNDAALSILDALSKQKSAAANDAIKTAFDSQDHLIRRRAVALLKTNGVGDFSNRIGTVKTRNTQADYLRAIARIGKTVTATVVTNKGSFTIEFLPEAAPLTVDNFIQLARKGYFNGQTIPRVVPNFVVQAGDPRGDQNGGPGYQIRCEVNQVPYERGALGMALSGKDTGGSQWFVTHSPQPHLDGGYTVFGRVSRGMDVIDNISRGDTIRRVILNEK